MKTRVKLILILIILFIRTIPPTANEPIERVILRYIDGFQPAIFDHYDLPNFPDNYIPLHSGGKQRLPLHERRVRLYFGRSGT